MSFYRYVAAAMVLGKSSPETKKLSIYGLDAIKSIYGGLSVIEEGIVRKDGRMDKTRTILFQDGTYLRTSHTNNSNDVSKIITYLDDKDSVSISDALFSEEDLKLNEYLWSKVVKSVIDRVAILIKALNEKDIYEIPLIVNDFPRIVEVLYLKPGIFPT